MHKTHAGNKETPLNLRAIGLAIALTCSIACAVSQAAPSGKPWLEMDRGPYLTASIESSIPEKSMTPKGVAIRVDAHTPAYVVFDTDLLRYSVGWTGGSLDFHGVDFDGAH